jgi:hypothetical protein
MSSTAFDDQFLHEPDLEEECRQARGRDSNVCVWSISRNALVGTPQCKVVVIHYDRGFLFCPFCGRKIEVKK